MSQWEKSTLVIGSESEQMAYITEHFQKGAAQWQTVDIKNCVDVLWLDLNEESGGVEKLRQALDILRMRPRQMPNRVAIIKGADQLSRAMANSLLKILEEPPAKTFFILTATHQDRVIATIRSRTHVVFRSSASALDHEWLGIYCQYLQGSMSRSQLLEKMLDDEKMAYHLALGAIIHRLSRLQFTQKLWEKYESWLQLAHQVKAPITWNKNNLAWSHILLMDEVRRILPTG